MARELPTSPWSPAIGQPDHVEVTFRPLVDDDLPLLHVWLNEPGIVRWWEGDDVSWEAVVRDYGTANPDPTEHWLALVAGEPAGWIQCYAWADYAEEEEARVHLRLGVAPTAAGIDYLVADPARRGRGIGATMIRSFVRDVVFGRHPGWTQVSAGPVLANEASWRALAKAGFRWLGDHPMAGGTVRVMAADRPTDDGGDGAAPASGAHGA